MNRKHCHHYVDSVMSSQSLHAVLDSPAANSKRRKRNLSVGGERESSKKIRGDKKSGNGGTMTVAAMNQNQGQGLELEQSLIDVISQDEGINRGYRHKRTYMWILLMKVME